jgi:signal transduction histidine kinase/CHASE2 domain-containing sensor protein
VFARFQFTLALLGGKSLRFQLNSPARIDRFWAALAVVIGVVTLGISGGIVQKRLEWLLHDTALRFSEVPMRSDVVLVDLDLFSDPPNPSDSLARRRHATEVLSLVCDQRPKVVAVAIALFEINGATRVFEREKIDAINKCPRVVAQTMVVDEIARPFPPPVSPALEYTKRFAALGHEVLLDDSDGTIRRVFPWWDFGEGHMESLPLATARLAFGAEWVPPPKPDSSLFTASDTNVQDKASMLLVPATSGVEAINKKIKTSNLSTVPLEGKVVVLHGSAQTHAMTLAHDSARSVSYGTIVAHTIAATLDQRLVSVRWVDVWNYFSIATAVVLLILLPVVSNVSRFVLPGAVAAIMVFIHFVGIRWWHVALNPSLFFIASVMGFVCWSVLSSIRTKRALSKTIADMAMVSPLAAATQLRPPSAPRPLRMMSGPQMLRSLQDTGRYMHELTEVLADGVNVLPAAIAWLDARGKITLANERFAVLVGADSAVQTIGMDCATLLRDQSLQKNFDLCEPSANIAPRDVEYISRAARIFLINHTIAPSAKPRDARGSLISATEITALRALQTDYHNAITFLSHDLRSPVAALVSNAQEVVSNVNLSTSDVKALSQRMERLSGLVLDMTDQFLNLARAHTSSRAEFTKLSLTEIAGDVQADLQTLGLARNVRIELAADAACEVLGDRALLQRALQNLVSNAVRFSVKGSAVKIAVGRATAAANADGAPATANGVPASDVTSRAFITQVHYVDVIDSGGGLSSEVIARLTRDTSGNNSTSPMPSTDGHGFGLLLVMNVARLHGAKLVARNVFGGDGITAKGALLRLEFPAA